jgi:hypothetical protein
VNQALTRNRGGLFLRLDWAIGTLSVLHWFGWGISEVWADGSDRQPLRPFVFLGRQLALRHILSDIDHFFASQ